MKIPMEAIVGLGLILSVLLSGCIVPGCILGSGDYTTENRTVDNFSSIDFSGIGDVYLSQGPGHLRIDAEDNIIRRLKTDVNGDKLTIYYTAACIYPKKPIKIYASTPDIESLDLSGSGRIIGLSPMESDVLRVGVSGSGNMDLDIVCRDLITIISGSGNVVLKGLARNNFVTISGSGVMRGYDLKTDRSTITMSGSGMAELDVQDELNAQISGSGSIYYKGHPKTINQKVSGSGRVMVLEE